MWGLGWGEVVEGALWNFPRAAGQVKLFFIPMTTLSFLSPSGFLLLGGQGCRQSCSVSMEGAAP